MKSLISSKNQKQNKFPFFLSLLPFQSYVITGRSMLPSYKENQKVLLRKNFRFLFPPQIGDVVVLFHPGTKQKIIKRIEAVKGETYFVVGDNKAESTDSRSFGWINKKNIIGKVIYPV